MIRKVIALSLYKPPNTYGPALEVLVDRMVAVEHAWDDIRQEQRSKVHLMGGSEFLVCETPEQIWKLLT